MELRAITSIDFRIVLHLVFVLQRGGVLDLKHPVSTSCGVYARIAWPWITVAAAEAISRSGHQNNGYAYTV